MTTYNVDSPLGPIPGVLPCREGEGPLSPEERADIDKALVAAGLRGRVSVSVDRSIHGVFIVERERRRRESMWAGMSTWNALPSDPLADLRALLSLPKSTRDRQRWREEYEGRFENPTPFGEWTYVARRQDPKNVPEARRADMRSALSEFAARPFTRSPR